MSNGDLNEIEKIAVGISISNPTSTIVYSYVELKLPQFYDDRNALV